MRPAVLFFDISNPGHLPLLRDVAERGFSLVMNPTPVAALAAAEGLPVRSFDVGSPARAVAQNELPRLAGALERFIGTPAGQAALTSELGSFFPHTGPLFFQHLLQLMGEELAQAEAFETLLSDCAARDEELRIVVLSDDVSPCQRTVVACSRRHGIPSLQLGHGAQWGTRPWRIAGEGQTVYADFAAAFGVHDRSIWIESGNAPERLFPTGAPFWDSFTTAATKLDRATARRLLGLDPERPTVLLLTSYVDSFAAYFSTMAEKFHAVHRGVLDACAASGAQLLVRPHPTEAARMGLSPERQAETDALYARWLAGTAPGVDVRLVRDRKEETIQAADVVLLQHPSSSRVEVMMLERPLVTTLLFAEDDRRYLEAEGGIVLDDAAAVAGEVAALLADRPRQDEIVRRQNAALPKVNHLADGGATARVAELVTDLAGGAPAAAPARETTPLVSIVIPVFNKVELTRQCLDYLHRHTKRIDYEVIVVDNASTDGTSELLRHEERAGRVRAIRNEENVGFGRACNAAAAAARGDYLVLLNNDTIPLPGWLDALVQAIRDDPEVGIVGSRLLYPNDSIQHAGMRFVDGGRLEHVHRGVAKDAPEVMEAEDFACVTGACILLRRELFARLGGFDERYYFYLEDVDLCLRVWDAGLRVRYCPDSVVYHLENASVQDTAWRDANVLDGLARLHERWAGRWPAPVRRLTWPVELPGGPRHFATLAYADELCERPELLTAYARVFARRPDTTLVIGLAGADDARRVVAAVEAAGLAEDGPDMLAVPLVPGALPPVVALYSGRPGVGLLSSLPRFDVGSLDALAALAVDAPLQKAS